MDIRTLLWTNARSGQKGGLPILSFPAAGRLGVSVGELVRSAALQADAMALVARETDTLAAVSLMDLSVEAEAFGAETRFTENEVPAIVGRLVAEEADAEALSVPELTQGRAPICIEAVRMAKARIQDKPVLAGMIGPYSLAGRLCDVTEIMYLCFDEPETVHTVLDKAARYLIRYARAMKAAGADGILMAEPLAGILSPAMAAEFSMPYVKRIIDAVQDDTFAVLYHNCGNTVPQMLEEIYALGAAAYHFGNAVDLAAILARTPAGVLVLGNIDPVGAFTEGTPASVAADTRSLLERCGSYPNFLPSSGCDIPAHAKWENIQAFFAALRS